VEKHLASQLLDLQEQLTALASRSDEATAAALAGEGLATQSDLKVCAEGQRVSRIRDETLAK
jgi:hypothetical protein